MSNPLFKYGIRRAFELNNNRPLRMWINQPSTLQPDHALHGTNVLAIAETDKMARIYFLSGPIESQQVSYLSLSPGWREDNAS
jgi:hypothetical protein